MVGPAGQTTVERQLALQSLAVLKGDGRYSLASEQGNAEQSGEGIEVFHVVSWFQGQKERLRSVVDQQSEVVDGLAGHLWQGPCRGPGCGALPVGHQLGNFLHCRGPEVHDEDEWFFFCLIHGGVDGFSPGPLRGL